MKDLTLHPLSLRLGLAFDRPEPVDRVGGLLRDIFNELGRAVAAHGSCVIGHIKGLALLGEEDWIKVNLISADRPAQSQASRRNPIKDLTLAVNFMVYGLEPDDLRRIAQQVIGLPGRSWSGSARLEPGPLVPPHSIQRLDA